MTSDILSPRPTEAFFLEFPEDSYFAEPGFRKTKAFQSTPNPKPSIGSNFVALLLKAGGWGLNPALSLELVGLLVASSRKVGTVQSPYHALKRSVSDPKP